MPFDWVFVYLCYTPLVDTYIYGHLVLHFVTGEKICTLYFSIKYASKEKYTLSYSYTPVSALMYVHVHVMRIDLNSN